jgi:hypothetical protein
MSDAAKLADEIEAAYGVSLSEYDAIRGQREFALADDKVRLIVTALRSLPQPGQTRGGK